MPKILVIRDSQNPMYDAVEQLHISLDTEQNKRAGYVYLIKPAGHNVYKIGRAVDLNKRINRYKHKYSFPIELVAAIFYQDYQRAEIEWHRRYLGYCLDHEWFVLPDSEVEYFKGFTL